MKSVINGSSTIDLTLFCFAGLTVGIVFGILLAKQEKEKVYRQAISAGVAEHYIDTDQNKSFRWKPNATIYWMQTTNGDLELINPDKFGALSNDGQGRILWKLAPAPITQPCRCAERQTEVYPIYKTTNDPFIIEWPWPYITSNRMIIVTNFNAVLESFSNNSHFGSLTNNGQGVLMWRTNPPGVIP